MGSSWKSWLDRLRPKAYGRKHSLVLLNGLAEQQESWYRNYRHWDRYFQVFTPNLICYDGDFLHRQIKADRPITIDFFVEGLHTYLDQFVQQPPYHLVASSLGGKIAVEFAIKYPKLVSRVILLCPSGMGDVERLPILDGVRRGDYEKIVASVFHKPRIVDRDLLRYYKRCFENRKWKLGLVRVVRGTNDHTVRGKLKLLDKPTLFVSGQNDQIVDPAEGERASRELPQGHYLSVPRCGHAPQIEKAWLMNRLVVHFLTHPNPSSQPKFRELFLHKPSRVAT